MVGLSTRGSPNARRQNFPAGRACIRRPLAPAQRPWLQFYFPCRRALSRPAGPRSCLSECKPRRPAARQLGLPFPVCALRLGRGRTARGESSTAPCENGEGAGKRANSARADGAKQIKARVIFARALQICYSTFHRGSLASSGKDHFHNWKEQSCLASEWISLRVKTSTSVLSYVSTNGRGKRCVLFQLLDGTTVSPPKRFTCFRFSSSYRIFLRTPPCVHVHFMTSTITSSHPPAVSATDFPA